jgi:manganese efflux pump family protein
VLALLLVAVSLGLSDFAGAVGIGVSGVDARTRIRVGVFFGLFETGMPIVGLLLGHSLAGALGHAAHWIGAALLIAVGGYAVIQAVRERGADHHSADHHGADHHGADHRGADDRGADDRGQEAADAAQGTGRLLVTGLALSVDNLAVGFALGAYHVNVLLAAVVIGAVSVTLSLIGLELGNRLGARTGERSELIGGLVLIAVGAAIAAGVQ